MSKLSDRVDALERTGPVSPEELRKGMEMLRARTWAALVEGATDLPPEPPAYVLAEIDRLYCTPAAMDEARAMMAKLTAPREGDRHAAE